MSQLALEVRVLGSAWVGTHGVRLHLSPSAANALAFLALGPREGRARAAMAASLFGGCADTVARRRLATALWRLRQELRLALGCDVVDSDADTRVRIAPDVTLSVDAVSFLLAVEPHLASPAESLTTDDAARLERAVDGYGGELLESSLDEWVLTERIRLTTVYLAALDLLVQHHGSRRAGEQVRRYASRILELEPLREDYHRHAMTAYARAGRPDLVERQFELCRLALQKEFGADPLPETVALYGRLTAGGTDPTAGFGSYGSHDSTSTTGDARRTPPTITALVADLERARRDVRELACLVERALDAVLRLGSQAP